MGGWVFKSLKSVFKLPNRYIKYFKLALPEYRSGILLCNCVSDVLWRSNRNKPQSPTYRFHVVCKVT